MSAATALTRALNRTPVRETTSSDPLLRLLTGEPEPQTQREAFSEYVQWVRDLPEYEARLKAEREAEAEAQADQQKSVAELFAAALKQANDSPTRARETNAADPMPLNGPRVTQALARGLGPGATIDGV